MPARRKNYSAKFKFQLVVESLRSTKSDAELARTYGVHPITLSNWKNFFFERGPELFSSSEQVKHYEQKIAELERLLGQKEVEIALLKNFLAGR
jgi:transposase